MKTAQSILRTTSGSGDKRRKPKPESHISLKRGRGNPNWMAGMNGTLRIPPAVPTEFERLAVKLGVPEALWAHSRELRSFARKFGRSKYVPEHLLDAWGLDVGDVEL
jgi:hypothetical protein